MKKRIIMIIAVSLLSVYGQAGVVQAAGDNEDGKQVVEEVEQFFIGSYEKAKENLQDTNILAYLESFVETASDKVKETDIPMYVEAAKEKLLSLGEQFKQEFKQGMNDLDQKGIDREEFADSSLVKVMNDFREIGTSMKTLLG